MNGRIHWPRMAAVLALLLLASLPAAARRHPPQHADHRAVNFAYIESQRTQATIPGKGTFTVWKVTPGSMSARAVSHQVGPPDGPLAGQTGLISTIDTAWVALAYCQAARVEHRDGAKDEARRALATLVALQRPDGTFPAWQPTRQDAPQPLFSDSDWGATGRAVQALGAGLALVGAHGDLGRSIVGALSLARTRVQDWWSGDPNRRQNTFLAANGQRLPAWLPGNRSDACAGIVLGFLDWYHVHRDDATRSAIYALCNGIQDMQRGDGRTAPWAAFLPRADQPTLWYPDGNFAAAALARASAVFHQVDWRLAAQHEADSLYSHLLASSDLIWQSAPRPWLDPQLPEAAAALAAGASAVDATAHQERYAMMAGLFASWFTEGDGTGEAPYDPASGRCSDDLIDGKASTWSPGASACAIWTLLTVEDTPARAYLGARPGRGVDPIVLPAVAGKPVRDPFAIDDMDLPGGRRHVARMGFQQPFWFKFEVPEPSLYRVDIIYLKEQNASMAVDVRLDGDAIREVPLQVATEGQYPQCDRAVPATDLAPGLHTLGVRSSGLWHSSDVVLDAFVIQPAVEWRLWNMPTGRPILLFRSLSDAAQTVDLPALTGARGSHYASAWDLDATAVSVAGKQLVDGTYELTVPSQSFGTVEW